MTDTTPDPKAALNKPARVPRKKKGKDDAEAKPPAAAKPSDDDGPRKWFLTDAPVLPDDSPVVPLGRDARRYAFIDSNKQFVELDVTQLGSDGIADLFAHPKAFAWLWKTFPRFSKDGSQISYDKERCKLALMQAAAFKGPFDFEGQVRGVGAWSDLEGRLHWFLGDDILVVPPDGLESYEPGPLVHGYVYPRGANQPRPAKIRQAELVLELFKLLQRWNWARGETDARLVLGWILAALLGGALKWRVHLWVRGPAGSGKSTLQLLLNYLFGGDGALVQASDASGAGIWQSLRKRSLPVVLDEMEAKAGDNRHAENVINLARQASSGGKIRRGGTSNVSHEFTAYSPFLFSSINVPPLEPQDLTRLGQVRLLPTPAGAAELAFTAERMLEIGRQLRRILVDAWQIWPRQYSAWRDGLIQLHQFDPRIADTWGTLLAMADLGLNVEDRLADSPPAADVKKWTAQIAPDIKRMLQESGSEWERMLKVLLQHKLDPYQRGQRWNIETLIAIAAKRVLPTDIAGQLPEDMKPDRANSGLIGEGLKIVWTGPGMAVPLLAVMKRHSGLDAIFERVKWKNGVYAQQFEQVPGATTSRQRFAAGKREPCFLIPLEAVLGAPKTPLEQQIADQQEDELEAAADAAAEQTAQEGA